MSAGYTNSTSVVPSLRRNSGALHLVQSSRMAKQLAKVLLILLLLTIIAMAWLPWQQTSRGNGSVIAYVPQERQQSIESPTKGVVVRVEPGLVEGSRVKQGDVILEIQPFAAGMESQLNAQLSALKVKENSAKVKVEAYQEQVAAYTEARDLGVAAAQQMVEAAEAKLDSKRQLIPGYEAKKRQAEQNFNRQNRLLQGGFQSNKEVEKFQKDLDVAQAELESAQRDVEALTKEVAAKNNELEEKRRLAQTKIDYARALKQDAVGAVATAQKEIGDLEIKLQELDRNIIRAPRDGTIFRMPIFELNQTIKEGQSLLTLIPDTTQKAVELSVNGNDMPLIQIGQEVRLQFEGWPAVQFAGWPSISVGTFSGTVSTVDATDDGKGQFRILVTPSQDKDAEKWPSDRYLRQGVRANGWVMLKQVSLGYEIWRQLNGFPVAVSDEEPKEKSKSKPPKLPK